MDNQETTFPKHVGIILDGNRRWAKSQGLPATEGHRRGADVLGDVAKHLFSCGVEHVSAFVFSTENWRRAEDEISFLMNLVIKFTEERLKEFDQEGIRIVILGSNDKLKPNIRKTLQRVEEATKTNKKGTLALCFNYGGQQELADACKAVLHDGVSVDDITPEKIQSYLYHSEVPDVDLLIRTSGEQRLSGFMLYRAAYAELLFLDKHWPVIIKDDIDAALAEFAQRQRRYGA